MAEFKEVPTKEVENGGESKQKPEPSREVRQQNNKPLESAKEQTKAPEKSQQNQNVEKPKNEAEGTEGDKHATETGNDQAEKANRDAENANREAQNAQEAGQNALNEQQNNPTVNEVKPTGDTGGATEGHTEKAPEAEPKQIEGKNPNEGGDVKPQKPLKEKNDQPLEDEKKPAPADNKGDKHTDQPAKFNRENYGNLREQMGKEAYEKAKEDTGNEDIAKSAQRKAEAYQAEKEGSHGKFSPEYQRLNHADAEGNKAKNEIEKNGGDEAAQEDAYRKAFGETYKKDKLYNEDSLLARAHENGNIAEKALGEDASDADKAKAYNDAYEKTYADAAKERKNGIGEVTSDDLGGRTVDEMRPGSDYYNRYKEASEDDVKIHHGEHVDDAYVHSSLNNDASGNFSTPETFSTPREGQQKLATPNSNTMEKTERVGFNAKNNDGQNVFVIEGKAAPQLHNQNVNGSAFEKIDPNAPDLNGGGTQLVTNTNGLRDGSMRKINEVPDAVVPLDFKKDVGQGDVKPVTKESLRDAPLEPVDSVMPNVKDAKGMEKKTAQPSSMHEALNNQDLFKENPAGEYTYSEGELGKSASGVLKKTDTPVRDAKAQREAGGEYRRPDDDGGHYIGARYGGDPGEKNLDPQNRNLNRGSFKHREDGWDRSLDNGDQIYAHVEGYKSNGSDRPDAFMGYTVTEHPDGSREWDAFSYQNESAATQEAWADELAEFDAENPDDHYDNPMQEVYEREDYVNRDDQ